MTPLFENKKSFTVELFNCCAGQNVYARLLVVGLLANVLTRKTRTQVSDTSMSLAVLLKQIIKPILLHNLLRSVSDTNQIGGKIKLNCLVQPKLI